jgi:hypothetical protein
VTSTKTRLLTVPRVVVGLVVLFGLGALVIGRAESEGLPTTTSYRCGSGTVEVTFGADMGRRSRPVEIRYRTDDIQFKTVEVTADYWITVDPSVPCPSSAKLAVTAKDVWGGQTECWIEINGTRVVERRTRRTEDCAVAVKLT